MPLKESGSREAFTDNLKAELGAGKPKKQALGIAYRVKQDHGGDDPLKGALRGKPRKSRLHNAATAYE